MERDNRIINGLEGWEIMNTLLYSNSKPIKFTTKYGYVEIKEDEETRYVIYFSNQTKQFVEYSRYLDPSKYEKENYGKNR